VRRAWRLPDALDRPRRDVPDLGNGRPGSVRFQPRRRLRLRYGPLHRVQPRQKESHRSGRRARPHPRVPQERKDLLAMIFLVTARSQETSDRQRVVEANSPEEAARLYVEDCGGEACQEKRVSVREVKPGWFRFTVRHETKAVVMAETEAE